MKHAFDNSFRRVVRLFLSELNTPRSLTVLLLIEHGEFSQLCSLSCDPGLYESEERYFRDACATDLLRKMQGLPTGVNLEAEALKAFSAAEKQCWLTNFRMRRLVGNWDLIPADIAVKDLLVDIRKDLHALLGAIPSDLVPRHGPGATFGDRGMEISPVHKMTSRPTMTSGFASYLPLWERTAWSRGLVHSHPNRSRPLEIRGNRFTSVPKDALKNRGIAIEPSLNVGYQLAIGRHLRARVRKWHIDLDFGQDRHRRLAADASRKGHLATIDLSSASDTVAYEFVRAVLPDDWFDVLDTLRSPMTLTGDGWHKLEKFSSMGNGFTFELETILFAAVCRACARLLGKTLNHDEFAVYGDDIIIPMELSEIVLSALRTIGFTPNAKKTFTKGLFRESCGGDYFRGFSVRPHFIKEAPLEPQDWIILANGLYRVQKQFTAMGSAVNLFRCWEACLHRLPPRLQTLFGPPELGDAVINTTVESSWNVATRFSIRWVKVFAPRQRLHDYAAFGPGPLLAGALYGVKSEGYLSRGDSQRFRITSVPYS